MDIYKTALMDQQPSPPCGNTVVPVWAILHPAGFFQLLEVSWGKVTLTPCPGVTP